MARLYAAAGQNDNIEKAYATKDYYRKVKNVISHPDYDGESYFKNYNKFAPDANKALILDLKCYLKDFIGELIAGKLIEKKSTGKIFNTIENNPLEFSEIFLKEAKTLKDEYEKVEPFLKNISYKLFNIKLDISERVNFIWDNDIALVELEQPFEFGEGILPSCLLENDRKQIDISFIHKSF